MPEIKKKSFLSWLFRAPLPLFHVGLGRLFGKRILLLTHIGRRTGLRRETLLEVVEYRKDGPEVVVANGFGPGSDWVRNIEARPDDVEMTVGSHRFAAKHRFLGEQEAVRVIKDYERRNRFIRPVVRKGFSWLVGWQYRGSEEDRQKLVQQIPLIAFRPRT
ncbi:MAG TPA: nitroreductase family deazaflavin-dependent oxidoreductase [Terriglobales bacterium]|jgi:deazaflavin-dependent oxidoreductase (nitroreductase family)